LQRPWKPPRRRLHVTRRGSRFALALAGLALPCLALPCLALLAPAASPHHRITSDLCCHQWPVPCSAVLLTLYPGTTVASLPPLALAKCDVHLTLARSLVRPLLACFRIRPLPAGKARDGTRPDEGSQEIGRTSRAHFQKRLCVLCCAVRLVLSSL
jgi:hypothetical protein